MNRYHPMLHRLQLSVTLNGIILINIYLPVKDLMMLMWRSTTKIREIGYQFILWLLTMIRLIVYLITYYMMVGRMSL